MVIKTSTVVDQVRQYDERRAHFVKLIDDAVAAMAAVTAECVGLGGELERLFGAVAADHMERTAFEYLAAPPGAPRESRKILLRDRPVIEDFGDPRDVARRLASGVMRQGLEVGGGHQPPPVPGTLFPSDLESWRIPE